MKKYKIIKGSNVEKLEDFEKRINSLCESEGWKAISLTAVNTQINIEYIVLLEK